MFDRVVIGVDPGMAATGLAAVARSGGGRPKVLSAATVRTPAGQGEASRLHLIHRAVVEVIRAHLPESVAVERLMWGRNVASAMGVARASGVVLLAAAEAGLPVHEYAPLEVKMAITGSGAAAKGDVRRSLSRLHGVAEVPSEPDAADALAVAVCHLQMSQALRKVAR